MGVSKLVLPLFPVLVSAQVNLHGKLSSGDGPAQGVTVMNLVTEQVTSSDGDGNFTVSAKEDDLLIFSSVNYEYKRHLVDADDIKAGRIQVKLTPKVTELAEVTVYPDIMPEQLGIPAGKKKYTPAERRYKAGAEIDPTFFLFPVPVLIMPMDPIINAITGRAAMLKKELNTERKEFALKKMREKFPPEYIARRFAIPPDRVEGFYFYLVEDPDFIALLNTGKRETILFRMAETAITYNQPGP